MNTARDTRAIRILTVDDHQLLCEESPRYSKASRHVLHRPSQQRREAIESFGSIAT